MAWEREGEGIIAVDCGTSFVILAGETVGCGASPSMEVLAGETVGCGASPSMEVLARETMSALVKPAFRSGAKNSRISSCERSFQESMFAIWCKSPRKDFSATPVLVYLAGGVELKEPMNQPCLPRSNDANHYCNCVPLSKIS